MVASLVKEFLFPVSLLVVSFYLVWFYSKRKGLSLLHVLKPSVLKFLLFILFHIFFASVLLLYSLLMNTHPSSALNFCFLLVISYFFACVVSFPFAQAFSSLSVVRQRFNAKPLKSWLQALLIIAFFISNFLLIFFPLFLQGYFFNLLSTRLDGLSLLLFIIFAYSLIATVFFYKLALKTGLLSSKTFHDFFLKSLKTLALLLVVLFFVTNFFYFNRTGLTVIFRNPLPLLRTSTTPGGDSIIFPPSVLTYYEYHFLLHNRNEFHSNSSSDSFIFLVLVLTPFFTLISFFLLVWFLTVARNVKTFKFQSIVLLLFLCINYIATSVLLNWFIGTAD